MKTALAILGGVFVFMVIAGAIVPRWNFHVVFAGDKSALDWHLARAAEIRARLDKRSGEAVE